MNHLKQNFLKAIHSWKTALARDKRNRRTYRAYKAKLRQLCDDGQELRRATLLADARHDIDGKAYFVLPDGNGMLNALNSKEIAMLKSGGIMSHKVTIYDLLKESLYCTMQKDRFIVVFPSGKCHVVDLSIDECIKKYATVDASIYGGCIKVAEKYKGKITKY